jgi:hypothetical protein
MTDSAPASLFERTERIEDEANALYYWALGKFLSKHANVEWRLNRLVRHYYRIDVSTSNLLKYDRYCRYACQCFQWCWDRRPDATQSLALGTWALSVVAFFALQDGRWALEQSQRAWIAPVAANQNPEHHLTRDVPFPFVINYCNTGREPAIDVNVSGSEAFTTLPPPRWRDGEWSDFEPETTRHVTAKDQSQMESSYIQRTCLPVIPSTAP